MSHPKHDISYYYSLKAAIEQILGSKAWYELKECTSLPTWRKYLLRVLSAIRISIEESVRVRDDEWLEAVQGNLKHGEELIKSAKDFDELLSGFSATLLRSVFWQVGLCPTRPAAAKVSLRRQDWRLDRHRSVQVIQTLEQQEAAFWARKQREIGFDALMKLHLEYRQRKSKMPFFEWCENQRSG